jgi:Ser/Thr protein kinase RdoA (MazF antagonist)
MFLAGGLPREAGRRRRPTDGEVRLAAVGKVPGVVEGAGSREWRGSLQRTARAALPGWGLPPDAALELVSLSENGTFRVDCPDGERYALRVHRPGNHDRDAVRSELAWVTALRAAGVVRTPAVVPGVDGGGLVAAGGTWCVLFEWARGEHPRDDKLEPFLFEQLGTLAARMHRHARDWRRPPWFTRHAWDADGCLGPRARWGRWEDGAGVGPAERAVLAPAASLLRRRLAAFGTGPDRFGLVHADMRAANLLLPPGSGEEVVLLDFDDCGWGWFLYDLGAALSFVEDSPRVPELVDAWTRGYRAEAPLSAAEEAELGTFVLLRRLLLVAWLGSHRDADLARTLGTAFTTASCDLAEAYLSKHGR